MHAGISRKVQKFRTYSSVSGEASGILRIETAKTGILASLTGGSLIDMGHSHTAAGSLGAGNYIGVSVYQSGSNLSYSAPSLNFSDTGHSHGLIEFPHSHDIILGILEGTSPSNMTLAISNDGGTSFGTAENISNTMRDKSVDITTSGWKSIRITSTQKGRVQVQVMVKIRIDTTMV